MEKQGLYGKYVVRKANGEPLDANAVYFTLRIDTDAHARRAVRVYIESCRGENPELADDLERMLEELETCALESCAAPESARDGVEGEG